MRLLTLDDWDVFDFRVVGMPMWVALVGQVDWRPERVRWTRSASMSQPKDHKEGTRAAAKEASGAPRRAGPHGLAVGHPVPAGDSHLQKWNLPRTGLAFAEMHYNVLRLKAVIWLD